MFITINTQVCRDWTHLLGVNIWPESLGRGMQLDCFQREIWISVFVEIICWYLANWFNSIHFSCYCFLDLKAGANQTNISSNTSLLCWMKLGLKHSILHSFLKNKLADLKTPCVCGTFFLIQIMINQHVLKHEIR